MVLIRLLPLLILGVLANDEPELVKANKIHNFNQYDRCQTYKVLANYRRLKLDLYCSGMGSISWASRFYEDCEEDACQQDENTVVCGQMSECGSQTIVIGACVDEVYVYINSAQTALTGYIHAEYLKDSEACDSIAENPYTTCGATPIEDCRNCANQCKLAQCFERVAGEESDPRVEICLPKSTDGYEIRDRCVEYGRVNDYRIDDGQCGGGTFGGKDGLSGAAITVIVLSCVLVVGFIGVVIYYRIQFNKTGTPPFTCPACCPNILFPKPRQQVATGSYVPPEFYLDS